MVGGIGMILLGIAAIIYFPVYFLWYWGYIFMTAQVAFILMIALATLMFVGLLLGGLGMFAYRQNYGLTMGLVSFILAVVFGWMLMVSDGLTLYGIISGVWIPSPDPYYYLDTYLWILGAFLLGIVLILWGVTNIQVRSHIDKSGLAMAAGIIFIIAAIGFVSTIAAFWIFWLYELHLYILIAFIFLFVAAILNAVVLLTAPTGSI